MSDTFLFFQTTTPPVTPAAWASNWNATTAISYGAALARLSGVTGGFSCTITNDASSSGHYVGGQQFVTRPVKAHSIAGATIRGQVKGSESNGNANANIAVAVTVINSAGTVVGTLLQPTSHQNTATEFATSLRNRALRNTSGSTTIALSNYTFSDGDYLCIELGVYETYNLGTETLSGDAGSSGLMLLPADDGTAATTGCAWVALNWDVPWQEIDADVTQCGRQVLVKGGHVDVTQMGRIVLGRDDRVDISQVGRIVLALSPAGGPPGARPQVMCVT